VSKRNLGILLGVILVLVLILVSKGVFKPEEKEISTLDRIDLQYEWTNNVSQLPSIALLDKEGRPYKLFEGVFDENEVKRILDGMVK
jgi:hypothetical protein